MLAICAAIQVLGHWYETSAGERVDGVGLLDLVTAPQPVRTIGEAGQPAADRAGRRSRSPASKTTAAERFSAHRPNRSAR